MDQSAVKSTQHVQIDELSQRAVVGSAYIEGLEGVVFRVENAYVVRAGSRDAGADGFIDGVGRAASVRAFKFETRIRRRVVRRRQHHPAADPQVLDRKRQCRRGQVSCRKFDRYTVRSQHLSDPPREERPVEAGIEPDHRARRTRFVQIVGVRLRHPRDVGKGETFTDDVTPAVGTENECV